MEMNYSECSDFWKSIMKRALEMSSNWRRSIRRQKIIISLCTEPSTDWIATNFGQVLAAQPQKQMNGWHTRYLCNQLLVPMTASKATLWFANLSLKSLTPVICKVWRTNMAQNKSRLKLAILKTHITISHKYTKLTKKAHLNKLSVSTKNYVLGDLLELICSASLTSNQRITDIIVQLAILESRASHLIN